jgi:G3E family GTPase
MIKKLNHRAKILEATRGKIDVAEIVNTGKFSLEAAKVGYGWLQDLHEMTLRLVNGKNVVAPKPETEEYNVGNFVWRRERPLHPLRFFKFIYDKYVLQLEHEEDEEDEDDEDAEMDESEDEEEEDDDDDEDEDDKMDATSPDSAYASMADIETLPNDVVMANRRKHPVLARLFRSKGEFFLASRPGRAGEWSQAGAIMRLEGGRPWFCTMSLEDFKNNDGEIDAMVQFDLKSGGEWGDRRQEIVFIGENLDVAALETLLDECLLDDDEFKQWEQVMRDQSMTDEQKAETLAKIFEDGFPEWPEAHDHDHDHDHENEEEGHDHGKREVRKISDYVEEMEEVS